MNATCPSCSHKEKADYGAPGSNFYRCTVEIVLPEFVTTDLQRGADRAYVMRLINLRLFDEGEPTAPGLNARKCPLWQAEPAGDAT